MPRKHTLLLLGMILSFLSSFSQIGSRGYDRSWKIIDSQISENGLLRTALANVNALYAKAKKENNEAQTIKALVYRQNIQEQLTDDNQTGTLQSLEKEIAGVSGPVKSILQSMLATGYWNYLESNRYRLYNRTATSNFTSNDPSTWSINDLNAKISLLFLASVSNAADLQKTSLDAYDPILIRGNTRKLRPTLFDLLAHRALEYFKNDERNVIRPAYALEISDAAAFSDAGDFAKHVFATEDSASLEFQALRLLQQLIRFHQNDPMPDALIDADIERIDFVNEKFTGEDKEDLYQTALQKIVDRFPGNHTAAQANYLLAFDYVKKASRYDPLRDTSDRYAYLKAREICKLLLLQKDSSEGKTNCANLLKQIDQQMLSAQAEEVNVPGKPFRMLLSYRNIPTAYFRVVKLEPGSRFDWNENVYRDDFWNLFIGMKAIRSFVNDLPPTADYQTHRVEVKMDALAAGEYAVIISSTQDFNANSGTMALQFFYVSNIAFINKGNEYYVVDRQTGAALPKAKVQLWERHYDYSISKRSLVKAGLFVADNNGFFKTDGKDASRVADISFEKDRLFMNENVFSYSYNDTYADRTTKTLAFLFADRSIYRPGQTLYFKGIVVSKDSTRRSTVLANRSSTVKLFDANDQAIDSLSVSTNEFGSYAGKFTLPTGSLNGAFSIRDITDNGQLQFQVEEYKRPKFAVQVSPPSGTYRLNDTIQVEGVARSYAGNMVDGASVSYRVTRKQNLMIYDGIDYKIWPPYRSSQTEIAHGTVTTDPNGKFKIVFRAIPEKNSVADQPVFNYAVTADVTDINGETRSANTNIAVGKAALQVSLDVPAQTHTDSLRSVLVRTTNMNGLFETSNVTVTIDKLKNIAQPMRERYWERADQFLMTPEVYHGFFPLDVYANENDPQKWPVEKTVYRFTGLTRADSALPIPAGRFEPGWYKVHAMATDRFGTPVATDRYVMLYGDTVRSTMLSALIQVDKLTAQPGDDVHYRLVTNADSVHTMVQVITTSAKPGSIRVVDGRANGQLRIGQADRGTVVVNIFFVKNNRLYSQQSLVSVPYYNKQLKIFYTTFRDKTLPGSTEKWKVKISGYHSERLACELLTSMYDASLDQFAEHSWSVPALWYSPVDQGTWSGEVNFKASQSLKKFNPTSDEIFAKTYDQLLTPQQGMSNASNIMIRGMAASPVRSKEKNAIAQDAALPAPLQASHTLAPGVATDEEQKTQPSPTSQPRTNLQETAFFFPDLHTDSSGNIEFSFTTPEALTTWKWMLLAHTKDLAFAYDERMMITQKKLMVQPNVPRFLRQGDQVNLSTKIVNLSANSLSGSATLELVDALTGQSVNRLYHVDTSGANRFTVAAGQSAQVSFPVAVPANFIHPLTWKITATAGTVSDGEESPIPVLSNRMLVTESLPLSVKGNAAKNFSFDKLLKSGGSSTIQQQGITVEYSTNPAWYAVQALPYLAEGEKENAEQVFNRYYADALATKIAGSSPRFKQIIDKWRSSDTAALLSNLQKNEELKSVLLRETPWVLQANTEEQQKRNIALLFDMTRMSGELSATLNKLKAMQSPSGGFVWCPGGPEDRYMTQYILTGIGHLQQLGAIPGSGTALQSIITSALAYVDKQLKKDYEELKRMNKTLPVGQIDNITAQYLYMRSFFGDAGVSGDVFPAYNYYRNQSKKAWVDENSFTRGIIALSLFRTGDKQTAQNIVRALRESAIENEELGNYWKDITRGYYWYEAPVESQALLMETFSVIGQDTMVANGIKTWLLRNKQTNNWKTTKATADACYALLLQGTDWAASTPSVDISVGDQHISGDTAQAGTGYIKRYIAGADVRPGMGNVSVRISHQSSGAPSWGSVYWQYFEDLDKISSAATPLQLNKKLFIEKNTDRGPVLVPLDAGNTVHVGDKLRVRVELRSDRTMEYVHMKDMRASCLEPVNVLSEYKWQDGLGYYESTKDASTDFFFGTLPKGTYVFEYSLYVAASGSFSNGVTSIQCMYAPEFASHSEGIILRSEPK